MLPCVVHAYNTNFIEKKTKKKTKFHNIIVREMCLSFNFVLFAITISRYLVLLFFFTNLGAQNLSDPRIDKSVT